MFYYTVGTLAFRGLNDSRNGSRLKLVSYSKCGSWRHELF